MKLYNAGMDGHGVWDRVLTKLRGFLHVGFALIQWSLSSLLWHRCSTSQQQRFWRREKCQCHQVVGVVHKGAGNGSKSPQLCRENFSNVSGAGADTPKRRNARTSSHIYQYFAWISKPCGITIPSHTNPLKAQCIWSSEIRVCKSIEILFLKDWFWSTETRTSSDISWRNNQA